VVPLGAAESVLVVMSKGPGGTVEKGTIYWGRWFACAQARNVAVLQASVSNQLLQVCCWACEAAAVSASPTSNRCRSPVVVGDSV